MYNYSKIDKIYIRNFRNLGDVEIDFSKSPIVTLVGDNESGKTSVIKSFAVCALHAYTREQKDFIRDNTNMFGISIKLDNGTSITRIKEANGINSYKITDASNNVLFSTTKLAEGLPIEVEKLMGLIEEPETKEFLHIRTYEDRLLFVETPNSTNYKVMYNALKVEQLTKSIKLGSTEANQLKNQITYNENSIDTLNTQLNDIDIIDIEPLINLRDSIKEEREVLLKLDKIRNLVNKLNSCEEQLGALVLIDKFNLQSIDLIRADKLNRISRLFNDLYIISDKYKNYKELDTINEINIDIYNKLSAFIKKKNDLETKILEAGSINLINNLEEISEVKVSNLSRIKAIKDELELLKLRDNSDLDNITDISDKDIYIVNRLNKVKNLFNGVEKAIVDMNQSNDYIEQIVNYMKQLGIATETCSKCGETVIFDIAKMGVT